MSSASSLPQIGTATASAEVYSSFQLTSPPLMKTIIMLGSWLEKAVKMKKTYPLGPGIGNKSMHAYYTKTYSIGVVFSYDGNFAHIVGLYY